MKGRIFPTLCALSLATVLAGCAHQPAATSSAADNTATAAPAAATVSKVQRLNKVYAAYGLAYLQLHPIMATYIGVPGFNNRLPNMLSAEYRQKIHDFTVHWLDAVQAIGSEGLEGQALISYDIFVRNAKMGLEGEKFPDWMIPINQFYNLAGLAAQLGSGKGAQPFKTVQDYANWRERAVQIPVLFNQAIANMNQGVKAGVVQPTILMQRVVEQLDALIKDDPEKTLFWGPVANMPESFSAADRKRITDDYRALIAHTLMPAYRNLRDYISDDYMKHTRATAGLGALPNGQAWYAYKVRSITTTDMAPAEIHRIGLADVARLHAEIQQVMDTVGFEGTMHEFFKFMQTDPRFSFDSKDQLLAYYRAIEASVMKHIPTLFSKVPKADFEIRPVPAFREKSAAGGSYNGPSIDGSRPGFFT